MATAAPTGNPLSTPPPDQSPIVDVDGKATTLMRQWMRGVRRILSPGISLSGSNVIALAKLTAGGTNGSITVVNGIITQYTAPT